MDSNSHVKKNDKLLSLKKRIGRLNPCHGCIPGHNTSKCARGSGAPLGHGAILLVHYPALKRRAIFFRPFRGWFHFFRSLHDRSREWR